MCVKRKTTVTLAFKVTGRTTTVTGTWTIRTTFHDACCDAILGSNPTTATCCVSLEKNGIGKIYLNAQRVRFAG